MEIEHIALWTRDIERLSAFYRTWFGADVGPEYVNRARGFRSRFLAFPAGPRLEIMTLEGLPDAGEREEAPAAGYAHLAFSVGSEEAVDSLTARLLQSGHNVLDGPRRTGDGYYESVVLDPDGNRVEITV